VKKVLVTGVNGFVGYHLTDKLMSSGFEVLGAGVDIGAAANVGPLLSRYFMCDLADPLDVARLPLEECCAVINLAGLAAVGPSFEAPEEYMRINTSVLSVLCDDITKRGLSTKIRVLAISSGAVYDSNQPMPLTENSNTSSESSPYTASKLAMEHLAGEYTKQGLECIVARPFNHIGPGQGSGFLLPDLYAQAEESLSSGKPMMVGNLNTKRDYTDVRDVVAAYVALITAPTLSGGIYNICSGVPRSGEEILEILAGCMGKPLDIQVDSSKFRPSDAPILYGDNQLIKKDTGWIPKIKIEQTITDYVGAQ